MATTCGVIRWWSARRSSRRSWPRRAWHRFNEHLEFEAEDVAQLEKVRCAPNAEPRHGGDRRRGPLTLGAGLGESTRVHRNNAAPILLVPGTALILGVRLACCRERSGIANRPIWPATRS